MMYKYVPFMKDLKCDTNLVKLMFLPRILLLLLSYKILKMKVLCRTMVYFSCGVLPQ